MFSVMHGNSIHTQGEINVPIAAFHHLGASTQVLPWGSEIPVACPLGYKAVNHNDLRSDENDDCRICPAVPMATTLSASSALTALKDTIAQKVRN